MPAGSRTYIWMPPSGQLVHRVPERLVVERAELLHPPVDRHEVVDLEPEMGVRRRIARAVEEVDLAARPRAARDGEAEVRRRHALEPELVDVEALRRLDVVRDDADVIEVPCHRPIIANGLAQAAAMSRPKCVGAQRLAGRLLDQLVPAHREAGREHALGEQPARLGAVDEPAALALERRRELRGDDVAEEIGVVVDGRAGDVDLRRPVGVAAALGRA